MVKQSKKKMFADEKPHFFKIIHPTLTTQHLRIPPDFLKHISKEESKRAILEGPSGSHWHVKLRKTADGAFLQDGWQDFLRDHSLWNYEFLVFRYDGNMCFNVQIFDKTGCEKRDEFTNKTHQESLTSSGGKKRGRPPKKLVESSRKSQVRPPKKFVNCERQGRSAMTFIDSTHHCQSKAYTKDPGMEAVSLEKIKTEDACCPICERFPQVKGCLSRSLPKEEEKAKVWKAATSFTSNLPHFMRCLNKSSVNSSYVLKVPTGFAKAHFPRWKTEVVLKDQSGKGWIVNFVPGKTNAFCGGWSAFAHDNKLQQGDICLFELVGKLKMSVQIFR